MSALRLGALQDALLKPGDETLAREAAEEVAGYARLVDLRREVRLLHWLVVANLALTLLALLGRLW